MAIAAVKKPKKKRRRDTILDAGTIVSWMIDRGVLSENGRVKYERKRHVLHGKITAQGILCDHCKDVITLSEFQCHAGGKKRSHPCKYIFEESNISFLQCQVNAWEREEKPDPHIGTTEIEGDDPNDDTCLACGDGGNLICCDGCPSCFHRDCLDIEEEEEISSEGNWYCKNCSCKVCGLFSTTLLLSCSLCDEKYHQDCVEKSKLRSIEKDYFFCGKSCKDIFKKLQETRVREKWLLEGEYYLSFTRCFDGINPHHQTRKVECNSKVAVARAIMNKIFPSIVNKRSLIDSVVFNIGSNINQISCGGFHTVILEKGDEIISVAFIRIHGINFAEMPFICTREEYTSQGMCRLLLKGLESTFQDFGVKRLIIPAVPKLKRFWANKFGFEPLQPSEAKEVRLMNMLTFHDTCIMKKTILKRNLDERGSEMKMTRQQMETSKSHILQ